MLKYFSAILFFVFFLLFPTVTSAQKTTVILLRHAEKDASKTADKKDPDLTDAGRQRAEKLVEVLSKYKGCRIYSTNYKRTRNTVNPFAERSDPKYRLRVQVYDSENLEKFADELRNLRGGCAIVVGHSNTTPTLVNHLLKQEKYKWLQDNEYDKIFILKVGKKKSKDKTITY